MGFHLKLTGTKTDITQLLTYCDILDNATNGLAAIKAEVEGLAGAAMRGTDDAATEAKQDIIDGIVDNILLDTAVIGALGAGLTAVPWNSSWDDEVQSEVADALTAYDPPTRTEATADKDEIIAAGGGGYTHVDWKGSFNWDTSAYTTAEQDISALFSTNLAIATRRKYSVKLDLTNVESDGSFDELYLAVKEKIDGTNYRAIDRKTVTKASIAATAEPGIVIDIPATSENVQITMQMKTALAGDVTIYYSVVKEVME